MKGATRKVHVVPAWHILTALAGTILILKVRSLFPPYLAHDEVLLIPWTRNLDNLWKPCRKWAVVPRTIRVYDGATLALIVDLFITPGKRRVFWFILALRRAHTPAITVASAFHPVPNRNIAILFKWTIIYQRLIILRMYRPVTGSIQLLAISGYLLHDWIRQAAVLGKGRRLRGLMRAIPNGSDSETRKRGNRQKEGEKKKGKKKIKITNNKQLQAQQMKGKSSIR